MTVRSTDPLRRAVRTVLAVGAALVAILVAPSPAVAHTEVLRAVPGPGEEVTGTVDTVALTFLDPVLADVVIEVTDGSGRPVAGLGPATTSDDGRSAEVRFAPLVEAGGYVVEYLFAGEDGDRQRETYRFVYRPAPAPDRPDVGSSDDDGEEGGGADGVALPVGVAVLAAAVAAAVAIALRRRRTA